ncbi:MAG: DUF4198 domain-containing protein [Thermoanaerobaculia bacterium]
MTRLGARLLVVLIATDVLAAHDLWIEPSAFAAELGEAVAVHLRTGEGFEGDPVPRDGAATARLAVVAPTGERALAGVEGVDPAGILAPSEPGAHWLVYESRARRLVLEAGRFERYLRQQGLDAVIARRAARGESGEPGRELYQRCAKSLVTVAGAAAGDGHRPVGCGLELLLDSSPSVAAAGGAVSLRVRFRRRPLARVLVSALPRGGAGAALAARTDEDGRVSFAVDRPGAWLFKAVHMEPIADSTVEMDWRSWWASLTLRLEEE